MKVNRKSTERVWLFGLMAALAQGIVGGEMAWPLVVTGAIFGVVLILAVAVTIDRTKILIVK